MPDVLSKVKYFDIEFKIEDSATISEAGTIICNALGLCPAHVASLTLKISPGNDIIVPELAVRAHMWSDETGLDAILPALAGSPKTNPNKARQEAICQMT